MGQRNLVDRARGVLRWENHLSRQIEPEENALERMQRLRRSEKVPPPTARNS